MSAPSFEPWIVRPRGNPRARLRLFAVPFAGGNSKLFEDWPDELPPEVELCAVELPGRQRRMMESPYRRLEPAVDELARFLLPHLGRPFAIFGSCTGSFLAFELARRVQQLGRRPLHLFVSSCRAPHLPNRERPIHALPEAELVEELERLEATPTQVLQASELMAMVLPILRADFELADTYVHQPGEPLDCPVVAFGGRDDPVVSPQELEAWGEQTRGRFRREILPGGHNLIEKGREPMLAVLTEELRRHLLDLLTGSSPESSAPVPEPRDSQRPEPAPVPDPPPADRAMGATPKPASSSGSRPDEGYVAVPGGRVWYRRIGDGEATPVLVLHGGPGLPHDYLEPLAALADERRVIFYDQLGCGRSDRPRDPGLWRRERFLEELARVREALVPERVHLVGHSWGTMLAVDHALGGAWEIASLTLLSPCLSMRRAIADLERLKSQLPQVIQEVIRRHEAAGTVDSPEYLAAAVSFNQRHVCRLNPWPPALHRALSGFGHQVYRAMWGPAELLVSGNLNGYERADRLGEIAIPSLLICGQHDEITPAATRWYHSLLPDAEVAVLADSSHNPQLEEGDRLLPLIREFLRGADLRTAPSPGERSERREEEVSP